MTRIDERVKDRIFVIIWKMQKDLQRNLEKMNIKDMNYEYFLDLSVRMTYHSNAIEGNTLTLNETATIILDSTTWR